MQCFPRYFEPALSYYPKLSFKQRITKSLSRFCSFFPKVKVGFKPPWRSTQWGSRYILYPNLEVKKFNFDQFGWNSNFKEYSRAQKIKNLMINKKYRVNIPRAFCRQKHNPKWHFEIYIQTSESKTGHIKSKSVLGYVSVVVYNYSVCLGGISQIKSI